MDFFFKKIIDPEKAKADADAAAAAEAAAAKKREQPQPKAESPAHMFMNFTQHIIPGAFGWGAKDTDVGANAAADANPNVNANNGDTNSISNTNSSNATNTNKLDRTTIGLLSPVPEVKRELNDVHGERREFLSSFKQMDVESKSKNQSATDSKEDLMTFSEDATEIAPPVNSLSHSIDDQKESTRTGDLMTFNEDSTEPAKSLSASVSVSVSANQNNEDLLAFIDNDYATTSMSTQPMHCSVSAKYKYQIYELLCWHSKQ